MKKLLFTLLALVCSVSMWADVTYHTPSSSSEVFYTTSANCTAALNNGNGWVECGSTSFSASTGTCTPQYDPESDELYTGSDIKKRDGLQVKNSGNKLVYFYVTGVTGVKAYVNAQASSGAWLKMTIKDMSASGANDDVVVNSTKKLERGTSEILEAKDLDVERNYRITVCGYADDNGAMGTSTSDGFLYAIKLIAPESGKEKSSFKLTSNSELILAPSTTSQIVTTGNAGTVTYTPGDTEVATVSNDGVITAVAGGVATITVSDPGSETVDGKDITITVNTLYAEDKTSESFKFDNAGYFLQNDGKWYFKNGWSISTDQGYQYAALECNEKTNNGFKVTAGKTYTINVPEGVTIRSAKVTMRNNYASGSNAAYWGTIFGQDLTSTELPYSGEEAVTKTFVITEGTPMTFTPGGNQCQMYVELLTAPAEPADPVANGGAVKVIAYNTEGNTIDGNNKIWQSGGYSLVTGGVNKNDNTLMKLASGFTVSIPDGVAISKVVVKAKSATSSSATVNCGQSSDSNTIESDEIAEYTYNITTPTVGQDLTFTTTKELAVESISLFVGDAVSTLTLTTTANMAGHRSFYDAEKSYKADANTTVYVATSTNEEGDIVLSSLNKDVPAGIPVILIASNAAKQSDRTFKITLTEANDVDDYKGNNLLNATEGGENINAYRLGYKADGGIGFYKYTSASAPAGIVYLEASSASSKMSFVFADETTAINKVATVAEGTQARKAIVNGRLMIVTANGMYTPAGALVK